jgi:hypothetical protein
MHQSLLDDDVIALGIDTVEMENGDNVGLRLRGESGGIPWSVILDGDGNELITSDGPNGNIGFPMAEAEIDYFLEMLRVARPAMDANKGIAIRAALEKYAETREF